MLTPKMERELKDLAKDNKGRLEATDVLTKARDERSALHKHPYFLDWEDDKAAEEYYLSAARHIISEYKIRSVVNDESRMVRAFIEDPVDLGYVTIEDAAAPTRMDYTLVNARRCRTMLQNILNAIQMWEYPPDDVTAIKNAIYHVDVFIGHEEIKQKLHGKGKRKGGKGARKGGKGAGKGSSGSLHRT